MHKIRIETNDSPVASKWSVFLDGRDISGLLQGIAIVGCLDDIARIQLDCVADIEINGEVPFDKKALTVTLSDKGISQLIDAAGVL